MQIACYTGTALFVREVSVNAVYVNIGESACGSCASSIQKGLAGSSCGRAFRTGVFVQIALVLLLALGFALAVPLSAEAATSATKTTVTIGTARFKMKLASNDAAAAFRAYLSKKRTLKMSELNGNEKYRYLSKSFPESSKRYKKVRAGDVMLYGDDCLVIFYKTHKTSYRYTKIGRLTSAKGLARAVGKKSVKVRFAKMKQVNQVNQVKQGQASSLHGASAVS